MIKFRWFKKIVSFVMLVFSVAVLAVFAVGCIDEKPGDAPPKEPPAEKLTSYQVLAKCKAELEALSSFTVGGTVSVGPLNGAPAFSSGFEFKCEGENFSLRIDGVAAIYSLSSGIYLIKAGGDGMPEKIATEGISSAVVIGKLFEYISNGALGKTDRVEGGYNLRSFSDYKYALRILQSQFLRLKDYTYSDLAETEPFKSRMEYVKTYIENNSGLSVNQFLKNSGVKEENLIAVFERFGYDYNEFIVGYGDITVEEFFADPDTAQKIERLKNYLYAEGTTLTKVLRDFKITDIDILSSETSFDEANAEIGLVASKDFALESIKIRACFAADDLPVYDRNTDKFVKRTFGLQADAVLSVSGRNSTQVVVPQGIVL